MATAFDDHIVRKTIYKQWFAGKRYIDLLSVSSTSKPLGFAERLVCSFVNWLHRMKPGEAKPLSMIASRLHLGRLQVAKAARELKKLGLVNVSTGRANTTLLLPTGEKLDQHFVVKSGRPSSSRLYLLSANATITTRDASLLMALYSIAAARGTTFIKNRKKGLASLASISRSQVDVSLGKLQQAGALVIGVNHLALKQPSTEFLENFRDAGGKRNLAVSDSALFTIKAITPDGNDFAKWVNEQIIGWQKVQNIAGWTQDECKMYWNATLFGDDVDQRTLREFLLFHFPAIWITAQEQHAETGQAKTCRHLLTRMSEQSIKDLIHKKSIL